MTISDIPAGDFQIADTLFCLNDPTTFFTTLIANDTGIFINTLNNSYTCNDTVQIRWNVFPPNGVSLDPFSLENINFGGTSIVIGSFTTDNAQVNSFLQIQDAMAFRLFF